MKNFIYTVLLFTGLACGSLPEGQDSLASTSEALSVKRYYGWNVLSGTEHGRCDMHSSLSDCAFPTRYTTGNNPYKRLLIAPVESTPVPSGFNLVDARTFGTAYYGNMSNSWEFGMTTQGTTAHIMIYSDEDIFNGTPPNATINLSTVAHIECSWIPFGYEEDLLGRAWGCQQVLVAFDVGAFTSWVNQWATTNAQRQVALDSIYRHFLGVALGLGSTNSTDTPMRRRLSRAQSPITIQSYEKCMLDTVNMNDPSYPDPQLGVYNNNCQ